MIKTTELARHARKLTLTLFVAQSLGSAGFIATASITSIAAAELSGSSAWAGLPAAVLLLGMAASAYGWGYAMDRLGRRPALAWGAVLGLVGASAAGMALVAGAFSVFLFGSLLMGSSRSALQLSRFVAAEVHPPSQRGRAISNVVLGGTVGAIVGPLLISPSGALADLVGIHPLSGVFVAALVLFGLGLGNVLVFLRPEPRDVAREVSRMAESAVPSVPIARSARKILAQPAAQVAVTAMVFGQAIMVMLMVITALHMTDHDHGLGAISIVMSSHTIGMYAFSVLSGRLADRWGREPVILTGAATLAGASLMARLSPELAPLSAALFLLGLGWNFCYVGGSSLLADQLSEAERARTQGANDFLIGLASALGSLGSGFVYAAVGYQAMGLVAAGASFVPLGLVIWHRWGRRRPAVAV